MAKFNIPDQKTKLSFQRATKEDFGAAEARGLQNLGKGVSNFGGYLEEKQANDELIKAKQIASQTQIELYQDLIELRKSAPDNGEGHLERSKELIKSKWEKVKVDSNFSGRAGKYLDEVQLSFESSSLPSEIKFQSELYGKNLAETEKNISDDDLNLVAVDPSQLPIAIARMEDRLASYRYNDKTKTGLSDSVLSELKSSQLDNLSLAAANGSIRNSETIQAAEAVADTLRTKEWQEKIDPSKYANLLNRADAKIAKLERENSVKASVSRSNVVNGAKDYIAYLAAGNSPERPEGLGDDDIRAILSNNPDGAEDLVTDIELYESMAGVLPTVYNGSPDEAVSVINSISSSTGQGSENFRDKQRALKILTDAYTDRVSALEDAPAEYALKYSDLLKDKAAAIDNAIPRDKPELITDFINTLVAEEKRLGVAEYNVQILTENQIDNYKKLFKSSRTQEGEDLYTVAQQFKSDMGDHLEKGLDNLYQANAAPLGFALLVKVEDPMVGAQLAEGLKNFKDTKKALDLESTDYSTQSRMSDYFETIPFDVFPGAVRDASEMTAATEALAVQYMASGVEDPVSSAVDDLINNRYFYHDGYRVPKSERTAGAYLNSGAESKIEAEFDQRYGDKVDWTLLKSIYGEDVPQDEVRSGVLASINSGYIRFITAPDDSGLMLVTNTGAPLPSLEGGPFVIKWSEVPEPLSSPRPKFERLGSRP